VTSVSTIAIINPRSDFPTYYSAEVFHSMGLRRATVSADLATVTVAAMLAPHVDVRVVDENLGPVDLDTDADFIGLTGKVSQRSRMFELAAEFRARGKHVTIGGPYASLSPEAVREHCDTVVIGELEQIADELGADLAAGELKAEYHGSRPDVLETPIPRWDLYPNDRAMMGAVQTTRGCPFSCEFCDVIQYVGRKQRRKPVDRVLAELDALYDAGYRQVFLADDNFTASRPDAKALLRALATWNRARPDGAVDFATQVSIESTDDEELLSLCAGAGLTSVFVGIETPNEESLRETKKNQNLGGSLAERVLRFFAHGIAVTGGMIVGFDHDGPDIFERQLAFAVASSIPTFSLGALVAPAATPLHARLSEAGRLVTGGPEVAAVPWMTNVVPAGLSREDLLVGLEWLCSQIYNPVRFGDRVEAFVDALGPRTDPRSEQGGWGARSMRSVDSDTVSVLVGLSRRGGAEAKMLRRISRILAANPEANHFVLPMLFQYAQVRHMCDLGSFWEPHPREAPALANPSGLPVVL